MSCTFTVNQMFVNWVLKECLGSHWSLPVVTQSSHGDLLATLIRTITWNYNGHWNAPDCPCVSLIICNVRGLWGWLCSRPLHMFFFRFWRITQVISCFQRFFSHTFLLFSQDIRPFRSSGGNDSDDDCSTEGAGGSLEGPTVPGIAVQTGVKVAPAFMLGRSSDSLDKKTYIVQDGRDTSAIGLVLFSIYLW